MDLTVLLVAIFLVLVLIRPARRVWKLMVVTANVAPTVVTSLINRVTPNVTVENGSYSTDKGEQFPLRIYHPPSSQVSPAMILYPGATPAGEEHLVINRVAKSFAKIGFRTFLPRLPQLKEVLIGEQTIEEMVSVFEAVSRRRDVHGDRIIAAGMSFGGSLLIKACMDERIKNQPAAILSYGSYFDLGDTLKFVLTGDFTDGNHQYHLKPHEWGRVVFFHNFLDHIDGDFNRENVGSYFQRFVEEGEAEATTVYNDLPSRDKEFVDRMMNGDKGDRLELAQQVLPKLQTTLRALSPRYFIDRIDFPVFLMHGANDTMVPFTETAAFGRALLSSGKDVEMFISYLHAHSDVGSRQKGVWHFLTDLWKMANFLNKVLKAAY